jgi:WW domain
MSEAASKLPVGWEIRVNIASGEAYYFNTITGTSHATLPETKSSEDLPEGWEVKVDQETGKPYFVDHNSKQSYWRLPDALVSSWRSGDSTHSSMSGLSESTRLASPPCSPSYDDEQDNVRHVSRADAQAMPYVPFASRSVPVQAVPILRGSIPRTPSVESEESSSHQQWERKVDGSGDVYYVDHVNKRSQWEVPEGFVDPDIVATRTVRRTRVTRVVVPPTPVPAAVTVAPTRRQPPQWERRLDEQTGVPYYVDHANEVSQWETPLGFVEPVAAPVHNVQPQAYVPQKVSMPDPPVYRPPQWERMWDSKVGEYYYVDHANEKTQWEVPPGFVPPAERPTPAPAYIPQSISVPAASHSCTHAPPPAPMRQKVGQALKNPIVRAAAEEGAKVIVGGILGNFFGNNDE